jgi:hypothetical protein
MCSWIHAQSCISFDNSNVNDFAGQMNEGLLANLKADGGYRLTKVDTYIRNKLESCRT